MLKLIKNLEDLVEEYALRKELSELSHACYVLGEFMVPNAVLARMKEITDLLISKNITI